MLPEYAWLDANSTVLRLITQGCHFDAFFNNTQY